MVLVDFFVPGSPSGKKSPKTTVRGGFAHIYADPKTVSAEAEVRMYASQAYQTGTSIKEPYKGAVTLDITASLAIPNSWSEKKKRLAAEGKIFATRTPDASNITKLSEDAIKGTVIADDKQVIRITIEKNYSVNPGVRMIVTGLE